MSNQPTPTTPVPPAAPVWDYSLSTWANMARRCAWEAEAWITHADQQPVL